MIDLVGEIGERGGLAIPAHVDADRGMGRRLSGAELEELLLSPHLAGLEFADAQALSSWFSDSDADQTRQQIWKRRQSHPELGERGLARLMSSDAHSPEKVGLDRRARTLTRLRLDDPNFDAVRNAIVFNPKARCKAEAVLPANYPWIKRVSFAGGFLDGVKLDFSPNLNCLIGGRGSGKSTVLLALRAALDATVSAEEDPDAPDRMPEETRVLFIDKTGSERTAVRRRGERPTDETGAPIRLRLSDLGQDESGRLSRAYEAMPEDLLAFLDRFVVRHDYDETERDLMAELSENGDEILRTHQTREKIDQLEKEAKQHEASLKAAESSKIEELATWVVLLNAQEPLLQRLERALAESSNLPDSTPIDVDALAGQYQVDLAHHSVAPFVEGEKGLRQQLDALAQTRVTALEQASKTVQGAAKPALETLAKWQKELERLQTRMAVKRAELAEQGLTVEAGALETMAKRLRAVREQLVDARQKESKHKEARATRKTLVTALHANRQALYEKRKQTLKQIASSANPGQADLEIGVKFIREGMDSEWQQWLGSKFNLKARAGRLAGKLNPRDLAIQVVSGKRAKLLELKDEDGSPFFDASVLQDKFSWREIFALETMRLEDLPRLNVREPGAGEPKGFDQLSAGQQRSVLLSLILCAEQPDPLVLDQPEDHLDARYIAGSVVRHLEGAKEKRQVILATHSPNLTVLGDAELVVPMVVEDGCGRPADPGAVDRPQTRERVCALLEGGLEAYRKRGQRYGLSVT